MKILFWLLLLTSCSVFQNTADYCKVNSDQCKENKKIHDIEVQGFKCRDLEWITGRDYECSEAAPK